MVVQYDGIVYYLSRYKLYILLYSELRLREPHLDWAK